MWTEQLPSGKYKAVERYTDPVTGKQKRVSVVIASDTRKARKEAQRILDGKIEAILGKTDYDAMTLEDLSSRYLAHLTRPSSRHSLSVVVKRLLGLLSPDARVNTMTALYVQDRLKGEPDTKYNTDISTLKTILTWGFQNDFVRDVSWTVKLKKRKDDRRSRIEDKFLEQEELTRLLDSMRRAHWKLLTQFLVLSGLRVAEALALELSDLDTHIHVTKTAYAGGGIWDSPKTADSNRDVFIQPELADVVQEIRKWRLRHMVKQGIRSDLFFPGLTYDAYLRYFRRTAIKAINRPVSPHVLRHTHASMLAASGMSLEAIARRLGHSDSEITKKIYFHVTEKLREKEEAQLSQVRIL